MLVRSENRRAIFFISSKNGTLIDDDQQVWKRYAEADDQEKKLCGFRLDSNGDIVRLNMNELKRVCNHKTPLYSPINVKEMRCYGKCLNKSLREILEDWNDQQLREILIEADEKHKFPEVLLEQRLRDELELRTENTQEEPREATGAHEEPREYKSTFKLPEAKKNTFLTKEGVFVRLTDKQTIVLNVLNVSSTSDIIDVGTITEALQGKMNGMSIGATITTLREKGIINVHKNPNSKGSSIQLTELGEKVYSSVKESR